MTFDESMLPSDVLLDIFFAWAQPHQIARAQMLARSIVRRCFMLMKRNKNSLLPLVTVRKKFAGQPDCYEIVPLDEFYPAEPEHQDYFANNPANPYCSFKLWFRQK